MNEDNNTRRMGIYPFNSNAMSKEEFMHQYLLSRANTKAVMYLGDIDKMISDSNRAYDKINKACKAE